MENTILEMQKNLDEGHFIAFVSANENPYCAVMKSDELNFPDNKTVVIRKKGILLLRSASGELVSMPKPARLYPKEESMDPNPKMIFIGSMVFAVAIGWIGIATSTGGL